MTIKEAYWGALLADATYALEDNVDNVTGVDLINALKTRMTDSIATYIAANFSLVTHIESDDSTSSGFDASVWRRSDGKLYVSMQGTEGLQDFLTDAQLAITGNAGQQVVDMVNWWLKITAPEGVSAHQIGHTVDAVTGFLSPASDVPGTGLISAAELANGVEVNGHSLGGYLATAFTRLLGVQAHVTQTTTFNSAGFALGSESAFVKLATAIGPGYGVGSFPAPGSPSQLNYFAAHGLNLTTNSLWFSQIGQRVGLFNEESGSQVPNHFMYKMTDALALANAMSKLDPSITLARAMAAFEAGSTAAAGELEGALDGLRRLLQGPSALFTPNGDVSDSAATRLSYYTNLQTLQGSAAFQSLMGKVRIDRSSDLRAKARNDFSALASLITLSPVVLTGSDSSLSIVLRGAWGSTYADWQADKSMTPADREAGKETYSDSWISDRSRLLNSIVLQSQRNATTGVVLDPSVPSDRAYEFHYYGGPPLEGQIQSPFQILIADSSPGVLKPSQVIAFGNDSSNLVMGGGSEQGDRLYGGGGNDTLNGQSGTDYVEGNSGDDTLDGGVGNDKLLGGTGRDTYSFSSAFGKDIIADQDGDGLVKIDGQTLSQAKAAGRNWIAKLDDGQTVGLSLYNDSSSSTGSRLVITRAGSTANTITVCNFDLAAAQGDSGYLGIKLTNTPALIVTPVDNASIAQANPFEAWDFDPNTFTGNSTTTSSKSFTVFLNAAAKAGATLVLHLGELGGQGLKAILGDQEVDADGATITLAEGQTQVSFALVQGADMGTTATGALTVTFQQAETTATSNAWNLTWAADTASVNTLTGDDPAQANNKDNLLGSANADLILGLADSDALLGMAGDDKLEGGLGGDVLQGGLGADTLDGGDGDDLIYGSSNGSAPTGYGPVIHPVIVAQGTDWIRTSSGEVDADGFIDGFMAGLDRDIQQGDAGNSIDGGAGDDVIRSGTGDDLVHGGDGKDDILGMGGADVLSGDAGDDRIYGDGPAYEEANPSVVYALPEQHGADFLDGGEGNDILLGQGSNDIVYGGAGDDKMWGDDRNNTDTPLAIHGNDYLDGELGNDIIVGGGGKDILYGGSDNDELWGDGSSTTELIGEFAGEDYLDGEDGDDNLWGGGRNDALYGGIGNDVLYGDDPLRERTPEQLHGEDYLDGEDGDDRLVGGGTADTLYGGSGNDVMWGDGGGHALGEPGYIDPTNHGDDYLEGEDGDDLLAGEGGKDALYGGAGSDTLIGDGTALDASLHGDDYLDGGDGDDSFGNGGDDTLFGGEGADVLAGGAANDYLDGEGDNDIVDGGAGNDLLFGSAGNDQLQGGDGNDVLTGGDGDDTLYGQAGDDILDGGAGNDILVADAGNDSLIGGGGIDVFLISRGAGHVTVVDGATGAVVFGEGLTQADITGGSTTADSRIINLAGGETVEVQGAVAYYRFADGTTFDDAGMALLVEQAKFNYQTPAEPAPPAIRIDGTAGADALAGGSTVDYIFGGAGNDTIDGQAGDDALFGESGNDTVHGGDSADAITGGDGNDALYGDAGADRLWGQVGDDSLYGGEGNDELTAGDGVDVLVGGRGDDSLIAGGTGAKTYRFDLGDGSDVVAAFTGTRHIEFGAGVAPSDIRMYFSPAGAPRPYVRVQYGADDSFVVQLGSGTGPLDYRFAGYTVLTQTALAQSTRQTAAASYAVFGTSGDDYLNASNQAARLEGLAGNDQLFGSELADVLNGSSGNDMLSAGGGADTLQGGAGNDALSGDAGSDSYVYQRGDGSDVIQEDSEGADNDVLRFTDLNAADVAYTRQANGSLMINVRHSDDTIELMGWFGSLPTRLRSIVYADGSMLDAAAFDKLGPPQINGSSGADRLTGTSFVDAITGGAGDDTIDGAQGNDALAGGEGSDTYLLYRGMGRDTVEEFAGGTNVLQLTTGLKFDQLVFEPEGGDLFLHFTAATDCVLLKNYFNGTDNWVVAEDSGTRKSISQAIADLDARPVAETVEQLRQKWIDFAMTSVLQSYAEDAAYRGVPYQYLSPYSLQIDYGDMPVTHGFSAAAQESDEAYFARTSNDTERSSGNGTVILNREVTFEASRYKPVVSSGEVVVLDWGDLAGATGLPTSITYTWQNISYVPSTSSFTVTGTVEVATSDAREVFEHIVGGPSANVINTWGLGTVDGGGGNDIIRCSWEAGYPPGQFLYGGAGNDCIFAFRNDDMIIGGDGDDYLTGGQGNDTYYLIAGETGTKVIDEAATAWYLPGLPDGRAVWNEGDSYSSADTVEFGPGIALASMKIRRGQYDSPTDVNADGTSDPRIFGTLEFSWGESQVARVLLAHAALRLYDYGIEYFKFSDGTVFSLADMQALVDSRNANTLNLWRGDGAQSLTLTPNITSVSFGPGIVLEDIAFAQDGSDLVLSDKNGFDQWRLLAWYDNPQYLTSFMTVFSDGKFWTQNHAPTVQQPILAQGAMEDEQWLYTLPAGIFTDTDAGDTLTYTAMLDSGGALPAWLAFDAATHTLSGTPSNSDVGSLNLKLTATDAAGASANCTFTLTVNTIDAPAPEPGSTLTGTTGKDTLAGGAGNDFLNGLAGVDQMIGHQGDDTYTVDNTKDVVTELANEGLDSVNSSVTYTLPTNVENLILTGSASRIGTGNASDNRLAGNAGRNTLKGAAGNDMLDGGAGADVLIGGTGNDTYAMSRGNGADKIHENDATPGNTDLAQFGPDIASDQLWFQHVGRDLQVTVIGTSDKFAVSNWFAGTQYHVEQFKTSDGRTLLDSQVQNLVDAMAGFAPPAAGQTTLTPGYQSQLGGIIAANWQ